VHAGDWRASAVNSRSSCGDADLEQADLLDQQRHRAADESRHRRSRISKDATDLLDAEATALRDDNAELPAEATQRVDA
jgi:hypothetical protein